MSGAKKTPAAPAGPRRGPGRPPSKPRAPPLEKRGIVDSPRDACNRLEFVYEDPTIFKTLFAYFKNIRVRDIHLRCAPHGLTFFARDHLKKSRVVAHVAGARVNWHYCEGEYWLGLNRDGIEKLFASIDKTFFKITLLQTHEEPDILVLVLKDPELNKECNYKITLSAFARDPELAEAEAALDPDALPTNFPLELRLTAKQFKKSINDASNYSPTLTFEKIGAHPFQLTYAKPNMIYNEVYRDAEKIQLRASVPEGSTFRCTVNVANVKSLATSMVTDEVRILCREAGDILFRSAIDDAALVVNTLTALA